MVWSVMNKQFTAKCPYCKKSHGKVSSRLSVLTAKCPYGEISYGEMFYGEKSYGEKSDHDFKYI